MNASFLSYSHSKYLVGFMKQLRLVLEPTSLSLCLVRIALQKYKISHHVSEFDRIILTNRGRNDWMPCHEKILSVENFIREVVEMGEVFVLKWPLHSDCLHHKCFSWTNKG